MHQTITETDFMDAFKRSETYKDNFTYEGLLALFEYLESYEEDTGEEIEFDMVALCCEYSEYSEATEAASNYFDFEGMTYDSETGEELETAEEVEQKALEYLQERTTVIRFDGGIIIQDF